MTRTNNIASFARALKRVRGEDTVSSSRSAARESRREPRRESSRMEARGSQRGSKRMSSREFVREPMRGSGREPIRSSARESARMTTRESARNSARFSTRESRYESRREPARTSGRTLREAARSYHTSRQASSRSMRESQASMRELNQDENLETLQEESSDRSSNKSRMSASEAKSKRKRQRASARADKQFARQFGSAEASADTSSEGAPRAAVYKTQMGSKHRKSTRMQRASSADPVTARISPTGWFSSAPITPRALKWGTAVFCMCLTLAFLYSPAQQYYQAHRELDRLNAEYASVENRNDVLDEQNDMLASDAGMEDAVREKYGYVKAGEETAVVAGLSNNAASNKGAGENVEANVLTGSVRAPEEWYTPLLDAFFGIE